MVCVSEKSVGNHGSRGSFLGSSMLARLFLRELGWSLGKLDRQPLFGLISYFVIYSKILVCILPSTHSISPSEYLNFSENINKGQLGGTWCCYQY